MLLKMILFDPRKITGVVLRFFVNLAYPPAMSISHTWYCWKNCNRIFSNMMKWIVFSDMAMNGLPMSM